MIVDLFNMKQFKYHSIEPTIGKNWNRRNKINRVKQELKDCATAFLATFAFALLVILQLYIYDN